MAEKRKKGFFLPVIMILLVSLAIAASLMPIMKLIYPLKYEGSILKYSREYELNEFLVMGVISTESNFCENAVSHKSAGGLMQLKLETAKWCIEKFDLDIEESDIYRPESNIRIGCAYLAYLEERYNGNLETALAAYNAGPGNVDDWLSQPQYSIDGNTLSKIPFSETKKYIKKVRKRTEIYQKIYDK